MPAHKGLELILAIADADAPGTFVPIGGLQGRTVTFNGETVDVTTDDAAGWRELLAGGGVRSMSFSGNGVYKDGGSAERMREIFFSASRMADMRVTIPGMGTFTATFQITTMEFSGESNAEIPFSGGFESAGIVTFAAAA